MVLRVNFVNPGCYLGAVCIYVDLLTCFLSDLLTYQHRRHLVLIAVHSTDSVRFIMHILAFFLIFPLSFCFDLV